MQGMDLNYTPEAAPEDAERRKEAIGYISYRSLLASGRAIKKSGHDLVLQFAGDREDIARANGGKRKRRVRYLAGKHAKRGQSLMLAELREARTDHQYNAILLAFFEAIANTIRDHQNSGNGQHERTGNDESD